MSSLPVPVSAYVVDCAVYVEGERLPGKWSHVAALEEVRRRGTGFVWVGLYEPGFEQIQGVAETYDLHELAVQDAVCAHQRPKLRQYDDTLFVVLKTVRYVGHESPTTANEIVESGEIMAFLGRDFIVTVRHGEHSALRGLRKALEATPDRMRLGPAAVLYEIVDRVVDSCLEVTESFERDVDEVESMVFEPGSFLGAEQIYLVKREIIELRRAITPLAAPLRRLAETETPLVPREVRSYFRNVDDHLTALSERVAAFDEVLTSLVDATLAKLSLQQSTDVRKITSWAAILAVPTMVAGIYGMNFDVMPELRWEFGYPVVVLATLLICAVLHRVLKRKRWL